MKITVTNDRHLTATRRRAIREILALGMTAARVGRITYRLAPIAPGEWLVKMEENQRDDYGRDTIDRYSATIKVN